MKKALIIAYHFPPARSAGVYRPVKFAKYLPDHGWRPVILTAKNYPADILDESLLSELPPQTKIYRAYSVELQRLENWVFRKFFGRSAASAPPSQNDVATAIEHPQKSNVSKLKKYIFTPLRRFLQNVVHTPDEKIGWIPFAVILGYWAVHKEKIDVIFSTSPPESGHLVALWLKRLTGKPMVVDFRDPWTTHYTKQNIPIMADSLPYISPRRFKFERRLESRILANSSFIIQTGAGHAQLVGEAFPGIQKDKQVVIYNGYDESDFPKDDADPYKDAGVGDYLDIFNIGQIYVDAPFDYFLGGLEQALKSQNPTPNIRLNFIGESLGHWNDLLAKPIFKDLIRFYGFLPHKEAVSRMMTADVLLLVLPEGDKRSRDKIIAGRTFELMRSGRPILMVGWEGESSRLIEQSGLGKFISCHDISAISQALQDYHRKKICGELRPTPNWEFIRQFERRRLTESLAHIFDKAMNSK